MGRFATALTAFNNPAWPRHASPCLVRLAQPYPASPSLGVARFASPSLMVAPYHRQVAVHEVAMAGDQPSGLRQVLNVAGHTKGITSVAFAQDCVHLALASRDAEWSVVCTDVRYDLKVETNENADPRDHGPCAVCEPPSHDAVCSITRHGPGRRAATCMTRRCLVAARSLIRSRMA